MTRAQQTISIGLLVTSVRKHLLPSKPQSYFQVCIATQANIHPQLYLALYLELVPLPSVISNEIIPVVRYFSFKPQPSSSLRGNGTLPALAPTAPGSRCSFTTHFFLSIDFAPSTHADPSLAALLGSRILRRLPSLSTRIRRFDIQRCTRGTRRTHEGD